MAVGQGVKGMVGQRCQILKPLGFLLGADLVALANRREHDALVADALRLRRVQVGNPAARRKLAVAVRRMLELERRA